MNDRLNPYGRVRPVQMRNLILVLTAMATLTMASYVQADERLVVFTSDPATSGNLVSSNLIGNKEGCYSLVLETIRGRLLEVDSNGKIDSMKIDRTGNDMVWHDAV